MEYTVTLKWKGNREISEEAFEAYVEEIMDYGLDAVSDIHGLGFGDIQYETKGGDNG